MDTSLLQRCLPGSILCVHASSAHEGVERDVHIFDTQYEGVERD